MNASEAVAARQDRGLEIARMTSVGLLTGCLGCGMAMGDILTFAKLDEIEGDAKSLLGDYRKAKAQAMKDRREK